ncbi:MAG: hypothetical protein ACKPHF_01075, partial [Dolichospermum sp.]
MSLICRDNPKSLNFHCSWQQRDELGTAVNLSHPHVVTGFHVGLWRWQGEDYLYLVMELAQGTLQD